MHRSEMRDPLLSIMPADDADEEDDSAAAAAAEDILLANPSLIMASPPSNHLLLLALVVFMNPHKQEHIRSIHLYNVDGSMGGHDDDDDNDDGIEIESMERSRVIRVVEQEFLLNHGNYACLLSKSSSPNPQHLRKATGRGSVKELVGNLKRSYMEEEDPLLHHHLRCGGGDDHHDHDHHHHDHHHGLYGSIIPWKCVVEFNTESPHETSIKVDLLTPSRNMELKNIPSLCRDLAMAEAALHHSNNNYINSSSTVAAGINQITSNKQLDQSVMNHPYHEDHTFDHDDRNHSGLHDHNNIIIPGLETPERSNTMSGYHNHNQQNMNQLMMNVNHWQTWGSDLELKASPKVSHYDVMRTQWRSCNNLISDCVTPNQGSGPNNQAGHNNSINQAPSSASLTASPLMMIHGEQFIPWSPSLLDLNLHLPEFNAQLLQGHSHSHSHSHGHVDPFLPMDENSCIINPLSHANLSTTHLMNSILNDLGNNNPSASNTTYSSYNCSNAAYLSSLDQDGSNISTLVNDLPPNYSCSYINNNNHNNSSNNNADCFAPMDYSFHDIQEYSSNFYPEYINNILGAAPIMVTPGKLQEQVTSGNIPGIIDDDDLNIEECSHQRSLSSPPPPPAHYHHHHHHHNDHHAVIMHHPLAHRPNHPRIITSTNAITYDDNNNNNNVNDDSYSNYHHLSSISSNYEMLGGGGGGGGGASLSNIFSNSCESLLTMGGVPADFSANSNSHYGDHNAYSSTTTTTTTTSSDVCWDGRGKNHTSIGTRGRVHTRRSSSSSSKAFNTTTTPATTTKSGGGHPRGSSERVNEITLQELSQYFNMPITQASKELKVGLTVLKKKCREFGIPRWPHRKMKSLDSLINNIQDLASEQGGKGSSRVLNAVKELEEQKKLMEEMPGIELAERTKRLRQACFKASYKKRRLLSQHSLD